MLSTFPLSPAARDHGRKRLTVCFAVETVSLCARNLERAEYVSEWRTSAMSLPRIVLLSALLAFAQADVKPASAQDSTGHAANRIWQSGEITRAEQPKRRKAEHFEVWNPWLTHWYTIDSASRTIKATEMVHAGVKRQGSGLDTDRDPPLAFRVGEVVRFFLQDPPRDPKKKRDIYVLDARGARHVLTVDEMVSKPAN